MFEHYDFSDYKLKGCAIATAHRITAQGKPDVSVDIAQATPACLAAFRKSGYTLDAGDVVDLFDLAKQCVARADTLRDKDESEERRELFRLDKRIRGNLAALGFPNAESAAAKLKQPNK